MATIGGDRGQHERLMSDDCCLLRAISSTPDEQDMWVRLEPDGSATIGHDARGRRARRVHDLHTRPMARRFKRDHSLGVMETPRRGGDSCAAVTQILAANVEVIDDRRVD